MTTTFYHVDGDPIPYIDKSPQAELAYGMDWLAEGWLADAETITSYTITVPDDLTLVADAEADGRVDMWLAAGVLGEVYLVTVYVETSLGKKDARAFKVAVKLR